MPRISDRDLSGTVILILMNLIIRPSKMSATEKRKLAPSHSNWRPFVAVLCLIIPFELGVRAGSSSAVVGQIRVQCLSDTLVRLEQKGPHGFEDRATFNVVNRNWPGSVCASNLVSGEVQLATKNYVVHVSPDAKSLNQVYVAAADGRALYRFDGSLNNSVWLPGPAENPRAWSFADTPRLVPSAWGITPAPAGAPFSSSSGWDTNNDAADVYVFIPDGSYARLRSDFLTLTGPSEMIPLWAFGGWDSRWYDYSEASALAQIEEYRARQIPLDALVCDTGWRVNASTGYQPDARLFPDLPRFFAEAHKKHVRVMFNDHPEPAGKFALDPDEVNYRYANLVQLTRAGLDVWWYDRNWMVNLRPPAATLRKEVWGMRIYQDAAIRANPALRPLIMANVDGVDNGRRNHAPEAAAHRYSIQWTGDIGPGEDYLNFAVKNAVQAGVQAAFPYESDDLGGHTSDPSPESYIRWIEYGAFSPIYRPHCTHNLKRMPWAFGPEAEWAARRLLNLRYRLLPEFYAAAHDNFETGEPILRRLDLDYPRFPEAAADSQYLIGHSLLVAPVLGTEYKTVPAAWLTTADGQAGLAGQYFNNTNLAGAPALARTDAAIDFHWHKGGSPDSSINNHNFTARWTGCLTIPAPAGEVRLAAIADDGVRIWMDGQLCVDNWRPNDSVTTESPVILKPGTPHQLRVDYLQLSGNAVISLKYRKTLPPPAWIPPGQWLNAWTGELLNGPLTINEPVPVDQIPLFIKSGAIFALAPQMQYTSEKPWTPITLDVYPNGATQAQTTLYEDDTVTVAYKQGQFRKTGIKAWANDANQTVTVAIEAATGTYSNAPAQRAWVVRFRRPPNWPAEWAVKSVALNGRPAGPVIRLVKNSSAMPLGAENGAPDADVFEVAVPASSILHSNVLVASFVPSASPWNSGDIGAAGASGSVFAGASAISNSVMLVRGAGRGVASTNDGLHFLFQRCNGSVQATVKLDSQSSVARSAQAGLMIRENLNPGGRNVELGLTSTNQVILRARSANNERGEVKATADVCYPCWLRLERNDDTFIGSISLDGVAWKQLQSVAIPGFSFSAHIGPMVTAGISGVDNTNYNTAVFRNLTLTSAPNKPAAAAGAGTSR